MEKDGESGNKILPVWIDSLLDMKFFEKCGAHDDIQTNDLNRYCITCYASTCKFCIPSLHNGHNLLTIYRHVYRNAVPLSQMTNHIDCANIQHYKCNKKWVVSLTPLPHNGSGSQIEGNGACNICRRKLTEPHRFRFCCVTCKVQAITGRSRLAPGAGEGPSRGDGAGNDDDGEQPIQRKRSRKGVPHRAAPRC